ncbi:hypothetical protein H5395_18435 [Paracoccus sp. MC1854]|uniref:WcbI family polysaccharide biosynthesis putative acetyltransferase n=1 Tax=Paracoccus sp. MC1854 TaxID=2760306 RepID=UPI0015FFFD9F|nr:hypothetical protein [Paracoccus sp. MC1854]
MKKQAYVVGNCQACPIFNILRMSEDFLRFFNIQRFPPVYVAKRDEVKELHKNLSSAGLLIAQLVNEDYRNNIGLGTETLRSR